MGSKILPALLLAFAVIASGCVSQETGKEEPYPMPQAPDLLSPQENADWAELSRQVNVLYEAGSSIDTNLYEIFNDTAGRFEGKVSDEELKELRRKIEGIPVALQPAANEMTEEAQETTEQPTGPVLWDYRDGKWSPGGNPPACPEPLVLQTPVDLDIVSSILYPGQARGNDFKPHGGFRTDGAVGPVEVTAPLEGYVKDIAYFTDSAGVHYMFDIQHECGIMYRLGHLGAVPPKFQAIAESAGMKGFGDSRTTEVTPVFVEAGEVIATNTQGGTGFDWGVYDLRKENEASKDPTFRQAHADEASQAYHAICWLDWLAAEDSQRAKAFPGADGASGKNSDYC